jgi:LemA protein
MVNKQEKVDKAWHDVEATYQRRLDLIPNEVRTVQGAAEYEKSILEGVVNARAKATSVTVDPNKLSQADIQHFQQVQDQYSSALSRLLVVVEKYPDLQSIQGFSDLRVQLEGSENRINFARQNFNNAVMDYNAYIRHFPGNMLAGITGFTTHGYFQASAGAEKAPDVEFPNPNK